MKEKIVTALVVIFVLLMIYGMFGVAYTSNRYEDYCAELGYENVVFTLNGTYCENADRIKIEK